jgi:hypothetical protein
MSETQEQNIENVENVKNVAAGTQVETASENSKSVEDQGAEPKVEDREAGDSTKREKPWFQKRIDDLTKEKWDARREKEAAEARARELEAQLELLKREKKDSDYSEMRSFSERDIEALAEKKAEEKLRIEAFNKACNDVYEAGKAAYDDFDEVLGNFRDVGGLTPAVIEAAIEAGNPHKILYELAKDRDLAYKVMRMPPIKMAVEIAKLASKPSKAAPMSKAPEPIKPVKGAANAEPDPEKMTIQEWMAWREKQLEEKRRRLS